MKKGISLVELLMAISLLLIAFSILSLLCLEACKDDSVEVPKDSKLETQTRKLQ